VQEVRQSMHLHGIREFIKEYSYLFWWVKESEKENINLNAVVESVLNYGESDSSSPVF